MYASLLSVLKVETSGDEMSEISWKKSSIIEIIISFEKTDATNCSAMLATSVVGWSIIVLENLPNSFTLHDCQMLIKLKDIYQFYMAKYGKPSCDV